MKRVDRRRWVAGGIAIATGLQAAFAGVVAFVRGAAEHRLEAARGHIGELEVRLAELEMEREARAAAPPQVSRWRIDAGADVSGTLQVLQAAGDAAGIELAGLKATQSKTPGKQTFLISGTGTPSALCDFVTAIEQRDLLLIVESGRVMPSAGTAVAFEFGIAAPYAYTPEVR